MITVNTFNVSIYFGPPAAGAGHSVPAKSTRFTQKEQSGHVKLLCIVTVQK